MIDKSFMKRATQLAHRHKALRRKLNECQNGSAEWENAKAAYRNSGTQLRLAYLATISDAVIPLSQ